MGVKGSDANTTCHDKGFSFSHFSFSQVFQAAFSLLKVKFKPNSQVEAWQPVAQLLR
jgi:hypothetical protein